MKKIQPPFFKSFLVPCPYGLLRLIAVRLSIAIFETVFLEDRGYLIKRSKFH
jgi:hypothetical protein